MPNPLFLELSSFAKSTEDIDVMHELFRGAAVINYQKKLNSTSLFYCRERKKELHIDGLEGVLHHQENGFYNDLPSGDPGHGQAAPAGRSSTGPVKILTSILLAFHNQ